MNGGFLWSALDQPQLPMGWITKKHMYNHVMNSFKQMKVDGILDDRFTVRIDKSKESDHSIHVNINYTPAVQPAEYTDIKFDNNFWKEEE